MSEPSSGADRPREDEAVPRDEPRSLLFTLVAEGLAFGAIGLMLAAYLSPGSGVGALSVTLASLGLYPRILRLFARHRDECWQPGGDPDAASVRLVQSLVALFVGIFFAFAIFGYGQNSSDIMRIFDFQFHSAFVFRLTGPASSILHKFLVATGYGIVMVICSMILTAIFKEGGVSLVLTWMGSLWGVGFISTIRSDSFRPDGTMLAFFITSVGLLTAGATGLFLARGAEKYDVASPVYRGILRSSLGLIGAALGLVIVSSFLAAVLSSLPG